MNALWFLVAIACGLGAGAGRAAAAPETLLLSPANMLAQTHSRAVLVTVTGTYRQLSGRLDFDAAKKTCRIDVTFVVKSLTAPNALLRSQTMSKGFLDPDDYPLTHYTGICRGNWLVGSLTLRGQTHPFNMAVSYSGSAAQPSAIHAEGRLDRYDWGVAGLGLMVSKDIEVTNDISLDGNPPRPL